MSLISMSLISTCPRARPEAATRDDRRRGLDEVRRLQHRTDNNPWTYNPDEEDALAQQLEQAEQAGPHPTVDCDPVPDPDPDPVPVPVSDQPADQGPGNNLQQLLPREQIHIAFGLDSLMQHADYNGHMRRDMLGAQIGRNNEKNKYGSCWNRFESSVLPLDNPRFASLREGLWIKSNKDCRTGCNLVSLGLDGAPETIPPASRYAHRPLAPFHYRVRRCALGSLRVRPSGPPCVRGFHLLLATLSLPGGNATQGKRFPSHPLCVNHHNNCPTCAPGDILSHGPIPDDTHKFVQHTVHQPGARKMKPLQVMQLVEQAGFSWDHPSVRIHTLPPPKSFVPKLRPRTTSVVIPVKDFS